MTGSSFFEPFGAGRLKLAKIEELDVIQAALTEDVQIAIDHRLIGCGALKCGLWG
ncbi:hypothetical protein [Pandoraea anapnoica]|uniref:hypothetical protein n=1 Tax=Pandoraea anapnoica TaxID=2508301 RepID=UPI001584053A|nr:hypothetical protein [Pandoraea anapnoica]